MQSMVFLNNKKCYYRTVTQTTQSVCASLTNVTGSCRRRRRGAAEDKPIVLSFDEEDDIDIFKPSQVQK